MSSVPSYGCICQPIVGVSPLYGYSCPVPTGKQSPARGLALAFAHVVVAEMAKRKISHAQMAGKIGKSANYTSERLRGEKSFTLQDVDLIAKALHMGPAELIVRSERDYLAGYPGQLVPQYDVALDDDRNLVVYQVRGSSVPFAPQQAVPQATRVAAASSSDVGGVAEDEEPDFDVTSEVKSAYGKAAHRGPRKADQPYAE